MLIVIYSEIMVKRAGERPAKRYELIIFNKIDNYNAASSHIKNYYNGVK